MVNVRQELLVCLYMESNVRFQDILVNFLILNFSFLKVLIPFLIFSKIYSHYFYGIQNALFFFAISLNILIQGSTIIENLRVNVFEKDKTISLFMPGILVLGILISWLTLTILLGLKLYFFNTDLLDYQLYYLFSAFLICLFVSDF